MAKEFKLPELGENITAADILQIKVAAGDRIEKDQIVLEIETDKATIEVPSDVEGVIKEVLVKAGEKAKVGDVILVLEEAGAEKGKEPETEKKEISQPAKIEHAEEAARKEPEKPVKETLPEVKKTGGVIEFKLPELGENIKSAQVLAVKVKAGDKLEKDQIILEIETDKATIEVPSDVDGIVKEVFVKAGEKADVGQAVLSIESYSELPKAEAERRTMEKVVEADKEGAKIEESKITETKSVLQQEVKAAETSRPKIYIEDNRPKTDPAKIAPAAPTVRRFAREIGVDINEVPGTGPGGRISIPDVKAFTRELNRQQKEEKTEPKLFTGIAAETLPDFTRWGDIENKEMTNIRRKTAEHLSYAWATVPHVTQFDKADITELERLRKMYSKNSEAQGGKLTVTAILLKIAASALKAFPQFNSSVDMQNNSVVYKKYFNIGVAVDTDRGLLVPVIKNVDKKNIIELAVELNQLAEKARNKKLSLDEMQGGCFTITNLGGIGGTYFTPIINSPEVAILGVSRGSYEQVYVDGKFEPRLMLPLSLSYDHRIVDGADGARFLKWVVNAVQQPFLMALEG